MLISQFLIDQRIACLIEDDQDLLERVVYLVNEFSVDYINKRRAPVVRLNMHHYKKKLLPLVDQLLDKRIPEKIRPFIRSSIEVDKDKNCLGLFILWNDKNPALITTATQKQ